MSTIVPRRAIAVLWRVFNDIADGFGITLDELCEICVSLQEELNVSDIAMTEKTTAIFKSLDTDRNGLIDALEFFGFVSAVSGMRIVEIFDFVLTCYDFDGTQSLSVDEVTLALKSMAGGLCKAAVEEGPRDDIIEQMVSTVSVRS